MYLPLRQNLTSDIDDMISEKKDLLAGSSGCSNTENINAGKVNSVDISTSGRLKQSITNL
jgi:hypothetical protein